MSQQVSVWGVFPNHAMAGAALRRLESSGFRLSQIAIEKKFRETFGKFEWSHAAYVRLPEGIVTGFAGGAVLTAVTCVLVARGIPPIFPWAMMAGIGCVVGTILGAFTGMVVARYEAGKGPVPPTDKISIGVLCFDSQAQDRATVALRESGAAGIEVQA